MLQLISADDSWFGPVVEVYDDQIYLGLIAFHFDHTKPAYYFVSADGKQMWYLCYREEERIAIRRFERRYYAARRDFG